MIVRDAIRQDLIAHARAELPNEACGVVVVEGGEAVRYVPGRNGARSPYRFALELDPEQWLELDGHEVIVFHSHVTADERPSANDLLHADNERLLILSLATARFGFWHGRTPLPLLFAR